MHAFRANFSLSFPTKRLQWEKKMVVPCLDAIIERLRFTFMPNGKHEFEPCDQVFPLFVVNCLLLQLKNKQFHASYIHKNCSGQFLSTYFLF